MVAEDALKVSPTDDYLPTGFELFTGLLIDEESLRLIGFENGAIADASESLCLLVVNRVEFCNLGGHTVWGLEETIGFNICTQRDLDV